MSQTVVELINFEISSLGNLIFLPKLIKYINTETHQVCMYFKDNIQNKYIAIHRTANKLGFDAKKQLILLYAKKSTDQPVIKSVVSVLHVKTNVVVA